MLYYSEKLEELFENEESLNSAEAKYDEEQQEKERIEKDKKAEKKRLAKLIEDAEADIDKARDELVKVKEEAMTIVKATEATVNEMLKDAEDKITEAQERRYEAIKNFNEKFGTYTKTYTGDKAYNEFKQIHRTYITKTRRNKSRNNKAFR